MQWILLVITQNNNIMLRYTEWEDWSSHLVYPWRNKSSNLFLHGVSQHMHIVTNLWKFELNWSSKFGDNNERKKTLSHEVMCSQMLDFETSILNLRSRNQIHGKLLLSWKLRHFRGSHSSQCFFFFYYQQLSIACYRVSFYVKKYFE